MLEQPDLSTDSLAACLQTTYDLPIRQVDFLPLGADPHTAVYRAVTTWGTGYFVKLRRGPFDLLTLKFPRWLRGLGIEHIIAPLETRTGQLYTTLRDFKVMLFPFVAGHNGYQAALTETQWSSFGTTLKRLHAADIPADLRDSFACETFSAEWRNTVRRFLERAGHEHSDDPVAQEVTALLLAKCAQILEFVDRADRLARALKARTPSFVACHADLHAGNIHIATDNSFYLVDWDTLTLAPKERDLMFIGGGLLGGHRKPEEEESLFYQGYGETAKNHLALACYRYERIIQDIAVFCEQLLDSDEGGEDRRQSLVYLEANFLPGGTIELAYQADKTL